MSNLALPPLGDILDIGGSNLAGHLVSELRTQFVLQSGSSARSLPTELFYVGQGPRLWKQVCWLADYHQTRDEIALLSEYGAAIAAYMPAGCIIVDMGSG